jgi:thymidine kinase
VLVRPPGRVNARLVDGGLVREGAQVVLGDTASDGRGQLFGPDVRYQVLCRRHFVAGDTGACREAGLR